MSNRQSLLDPFSPKEHTSVRKIYIQNLVNLLNVCLLKGDTQRAGRAWSILIRCREVDWKTRWRWALEILATTLESSSNVTSLTEDSTSSPDAPHDAEEKKRQLERWLRTLRVSVTESERPAVLGALILHLIKFKQYRTALDELETYLTSYPYILSGPLHTYAGLLCFYLAQPEDVRHNTGPSSTNGAIPTGRLDGIDLPHHDSSSFDRRPGVGEVNENMIRQAKGWFIKAIEIAPDEVASKFIRMIETGEYGTSQTDLERFVRSSTVSDVQNELDSIVGEDKSDCSFSDFD